MGKYEADWRNGADAHAEDLRKKYKLGNGPEWDRVLLGIEALERQRVLNKEALRMLKQNAAQIRSSRSSIHRKGLIMDERQWWGVHGLNVQAGGMTYQEQCDYLKYLRRLDGEEKRAEQKAVRAVEREERSKLSKTDRLVEELLGPRQKRKHSTSDGDTDSLTKAPKAPKALNAAKPDAPRDPTLPASPPPQGSPARLTASKCTPTTAKTAPTNRLGSSWLGEWEADFGIPLAGGGLLDALNMAPGHNKTLVANNPSLEELLNQSTALGEGDSDHGDELLNAMAGAESSEEQFGVYSEE